MTQKDMCAQNGSFRNRQSFTMASNAAIRDKELSLKAKGLYTLIMSYITMPDFTLTKVFLLKHCMEGERAFNSAWDELKHHGFLKVHFIPAGENGGWCAEYELLDVASMEEGIHTYYYNRKGEITKTNLTRKNLKQTVEDSGVQQTERNPQNVGNGDRTIQNRSNGKRTYAERSNENVGNNIILPDNTDFNTSDNQSIEGAAKEEVMTELSETQIIPYCYAQKKEKMTCAIRYLTDWDFKQRYPEMKGDQVDQRKMSAFNFCVDCLIEMACSLKLQNYRGSRVSYRQVIDSINEHSNGCQEGGLGEFIERAVDDFMNAKQKREICDLRKYTMSVLWNCFATYQVKNNSYQM